MTIGQLSKSTGIDSQTIRYYERIGVLEIPDRTESNYRDYNPSFVTKLNFINRAKNIGFTLNDIKILLDLANGNLNSCAEVRIFAQSRLGKIREQILHLQAMEQTLMQLVDQCRSNEPISECPILESLTEAKMEEAS